MAKLLAYEYHSSNDLKTRKAARKMASDHQRTPDFIFVVYDGRQKIDVVWIGGIPYKVQQHPDYERKS